MSHLSFYKVVSDLFTIPHKLKLWLPSLSRLLTYQKKEKSYTVGSTLRPRVPHLGAF